MTDLDRAIGRASERWVLGGTHVDDEAAYLDRALLAKEVLRLRTELAQAITALAQAEAEIDRLTDETTTGAF